MIPEQYRALALRALHAAQQGATSVHFDTTLGANGNTVTTRLSLLPGGQRRLHFDVSGGDQPAATQDPTVPGTPAGVLGGRSGAGAAAAGAAAAGAAVLAANNARLAAVADLRSCQDQLASQLAVVEQRNTDVGAARRASGRGSVAVQTAGGRLRVAEEAADAIRASIIAKERVVSQTEDALAEARGFSDRFEEGRVGATEGRGVGQRRGRVPLGAQPAAVGVAVPDRVRRPR